MPRGRPQALWLRQVASHPKDTGMTGLASAGAMVRRRPEEYRQSQGGRGDALLRRMPHT